jgi:3-oxoadipate enol-lactonase
MDGLSIGESDNLRQIGKKGGMTSSEWHFEVSGQGNAPLVFVHGWCCHSAQFGRLAEALESGFRIYLPDLPGHGNTPLGDFRPGFEAYADGLAAWIRDVGLDCPILIGHSMGGALALMTATRIPVRAVVNLDGSLPAAATTLDAQATLRSWLGLPDFLPRLASAIRAGYFLPQEVDAEAEEVIRGMCSAPEAVLRFLPETIGTLDASRILPDVQIPVMYIGAEHPRFDADQAQALLPQMQLEQICGAGHFLHMRAPELVAELAMDFLNPTSKGA